MDPTIAGVIIGAVIVLLFYIFVREIFGFKHYKLLKSIPYGDISKDHTAIIVAIYPKRRIIKNIFMYNSGLELLVKGLRELEEPHAIYPCKTREECLNYISKSETKKI